MNHLDTGRQGEEMAGMFLKKNGYIILECRYRCKLGEIDIIAKKNGVIVFIEVKTRRNTHFGLPAEAVGYRKQSKIIKTAWQYLLYSHNQQMPFRFDIIEVILSSPVTINHIENAFGR